VPLAAGQALVLTHHADRLEARVLIGADRRRVVRGGVDDESMVASLADQVLRHRPHGFRAEALSLDFLRKEDVDAGVAVHRVVLFVVLDESDHLALELDREDRALVGPGGLARELFQLRLAPRGRDSRLRLDCRNLRDVRRRQRPDHDPLSS
jgi:hypothetical protein